MHALRELTQREERLQTKTTALRKAEAIESVNSELDTVIQQIKEVHAQHTRKGDPFYSA